MFEKKKEKASIKEVNKYDLKIGSTIYKYRLNEKTGDIRESSSTVDFICLEYVRHQNKEFGELQLKYKDIDTIDMWYTIYTPCQRHEVELQMMFGTFISSECTDIRRDAEEQFEDLQMLISKINKMGKIIRR